VRARALTGAAGLAWSQSDLTAAAAFAGDALAAAEAADDNASAIAAHTVLGVAAKDDGRLDDARHHLQQSGALAAATGDDRGVVVAKLNLACVALDAGDLDDAETLFQEVHAYHRRAGAPDEGIGFALLNLGLTAQRRGRVEDARARFSGALEAFTRIGFRQQVGHALQGLAAVAAIAGDASEAARLLGSADALLADVGAGALDGAMVDETALASRARLGEDAYAAAYAAGRTSEASG
jgi:tetratricopeptide (TPR) repeat protein